MAEWKGPIFDIAAEFELRGKGELVNEFLETLINDPDIPVKLRRQVWTMCSTIWPDQVTFIKVIVYHFVNSEDESNLTELWQAVVDDTWARFPSMPLKSELEELNG